MIRSNKKIKTNDPKKGNTIHSGSFMTSYLHDDHTDFNNEMPIASPDALKYDELNEVPVNALNHEDQIEIGSIKVSNVNMSIHSGVNDEKNGKDPSSKDPDKNIGNEKTTQQKKQNSEANTISGGLSLNKTNKSLKNLILYIKTTYSNNLTSPKWKNFKGLKLQVVEKIRLNNVIWRTWFEQYGYGNKKMQIKKKTRLLCQFAMDPEDPMKHRNPRVAVLEGEYWKRRLGSITNEYKKWRKISRKHVKFTEENNRQKDSPKFYGVQTAKNNLNEIQTVENNYQNFENSSINRSNAGYENNGGNVNNSYYDNGSSFTNSNYISNSFSQSTNDNYMFNQNNTGSNGITNQISTSGALVDNVSNHVHPPIVSKQVPFTNRCRSPSPGLFQDINMFNFSSDTLFGTNYLEDHKDPIFGNNPDLFQPDLMHLYPSFDFFDLDYNGDLGSNHTDSNPSNLNYQQQTSHSYSNHSSPNEYAPRNSNENRYHMYSNQIDMSKKGNNANNSDQVAIYHQPHQSQQPQQSQQTQQHQQHQQRHQEHQQNQYAVISHMSVDDAVDNLYNFNTLATAAAALPNLSQINTNHYEGRNDVQKSPELMINQTKNTSKNASKKIANTNKLKQQAANNHHINDQHDNFTNNNTAKLASNDSLSSNDVNALNCNTMNASMNGSSNTIRNLLAQHSPHSMTLNEPVNQSIQNIVQNNIRSSGVYSTIPTSTNQIFQQSNKYQQQYYSTSPNINNSLIPNFSQAEKKPANSQKTPNNSHAIDNTQKYKSQQISSLLSAVLAPSLDNNNKTQMANLGQDSPPETTKKSKRGRKNSVKVNGANNDKDSDTEPPHIKSSRQKKSVSGKQSLESNVDNSKTYKPSQNNQEQYLQGYLNQQKLSNMLTDSQQEKPNTGLHSNEPFSRYNSHSSESSEHMSKSNSHNKLPTYLNDESVTPISRSRSSSVNNTNPSDQSLTTAEQKRRCNIQYGFDRLQTLVPSLKDAKNSKASKATMLKKTSDYIKELKLAREKRVADLAAYQREIEELSNKITECQIKLPANGVMVTSSLNKTELFEKKFKSYVQEKTMENWKFYLFSLILKPLFENFITTLNTSSKQDTERTFYQWQEKYCNLIQLRPIVSNYLRQISKSTSILTDSSKLPEECYIAAITKI